MVELADDPVGDLVADRGNPPEGVTSAHPLRELATHLPLEPGVYRFLGGDGQVLYVGKAKHLRKRVLQYFRSTGLPIKTQMMLALAKGLTFAVTQTESQALVLEANLIKEFRPKFNVLYKDDKSYPYLHLSADAPYPRLTIHRGARPREGWYFGPYPSTQALRATLKWLQRVFPIRQCDANKFNHRQRPCLQYQIHRCGAPCCGRVDPGQYAAWVGEIKLFLEGRDSLLMEQLQQEMWNAAEQREFESAARIRDRLQVLIRIREEHRLNLSPAGGGGEGGDLDVIGLAQGQGRWAIQIFFIRGGINLGNRGFLPDQAKDAEPAELLETFLTWFYADQSPPPEILTSHPPAEEGLLTAALTGRREGKVRLIQPLRGVKRQLVAMAVANAHHLLAAEIEVKPDTSGLLEELARILGLTTSLQRVEAYDISHTQDEAPVGARVVLDRSGFCKDQYRRYVLNDPAAVDDTSRMRLMLHRRLQRLSREVDHRPDLILLDGGRGQLNAVLAAAADLQHVLPPMVAMAKGEDRNAGNERLFLPDRLDPIILPEHSPVLQLLQRIRDEAHRFAITFHRQKRANVRRGSLLDRIPGIGEKRRGLLLRRFGSVKGIRLASLVELMEVAGISRELAERIRGFFQESD